MLYLRCRLHDRQGTHISVTVRDTPTSTRVAATASNMIIGHGLLLRLAALGEAIAADQQQHHLYPTGQHTHALCGNQRDPRPWQPPHATVPGVRLTDACCSATKADERDFIPLRLLRLRSGH